MLYKLVELIILILFMILYYNWLFYTPNFEQTVQTALNTKSYLKGSENLSVLGGIHPQCSVINVNEINDKAKKWIYSRKQC